MSESSEDSNLQKFSQIKSMQNDLSKYLNEIRQQQAENRELVAKMKQHRRLNKNEDQGVMFESLEKQIANLTERCENTENVLNCLNNMFNNLVIENYSDFIQAQTQEEEEQQQQEPLNYSRSKDDSNFTHNTSNEDSNEQKEDLSYLEYSVSELERPYDISNSNFKNSDGELYSTHEISVLLKETLIKFKISQQIFAETILNMKQANLSVLLSQPSSWETLTQINRNRFLTILMWLQDPRRLEKVEHLKSKLILGNNNASKQNQNMKRQRIVLTKFQQDKLREQFNVNAYPSSDEIDLLAIELNLNAKKISTWFTHQRQINRFVKLKFI